MNFTEFKKQWASGQKIFELKTSGSTGPAKTIFLEKEKLIWSAQRTLGFLPSKPSAVYICLPTNKVGGFMQMVRAVVWDVGVYEKEVSAEPRLNKDVINASISLTPMQLYNIIQSKENLAKLHLAHSILIGGGDVGFPIPKNLLPKLYHTYGMTETYSHIAYRKMNADFFTPLPEVELQLATDSCLQIRCFLTDNKWLKTNDLVAFQSLGFKVLGRKDDVINSGGLKLYPKEMEAQILAKVPNAFQRFFIAGMPDEILGMKAVLVKEKGLEIDLEQVQSKNLKYVKSILNVHKMLLTETMKINRKRTLQEALNG